MTFDRTTIRLVTVSLAVLAVASLAGIVFLSATSHPIPDVLQNVVIGAMSALAALLASTKSEPLQVTAPPDQPVPVVEKAAGKATKAAKKDAGHLDTVTGAILLAIGLATLIFTLLIASKIGVW